MNGIRLAMAASLSIALAGCMHARLGPMPLPVADPSLDAGGTCNADSVRYVLGKTVDERLAEDARVRAGARVVRVLRPGVAHDDEKRVSRLDLDVDDLGRVVAVRCL